MEDAAQQCGHRRGRIENLASGGNGKAISAGELPRLGLEACLVKPVKQSRLFDCLVNGIGMNDYLSKPVRLPELKAALERWKQTVQ
jgi:CheY-like chemotaxis protein